MTDAFNFVYTEYVKPTRHYHDINHIIKMLKNAPIYGDVNKIYDKYDSDKDQYFTLTRPLYHAILFHDYTYDIPFGPFSNEKLSAIEYNNWAIDHSIEDDLDQVIGMIEATEHHFDGSKYDDYLTNLLLDLDILGFADDWESFLATQKLVDAEFLTVYPKQMVQEGRKKFLTNIYDNQLLQYRVIDKGDVLRNRAYNNIGRILALWPALYPEEHNVYHY